ncbi:MAG: hypothetical protein E6Q88_14805, partial [Lysobacteraceae bacterium]
QVNDPNQGVWSFSYNALGEVLSQTDARGVTTHLAYDKLGRPTARTASIEITGDTIADTIADSWRYDPANALGQPLSQTRTISRSLPAYNLPHAHRPVQHRSAGDPGPDGGGHRQTLPAAMQAAGCGIGGVGDDHLGSAFLEHPQVAASNGPRRRACADQRADRRYHARGHGGSCALQRRARRADHRYQHGLSGEESLQRMGRFGADARRGAGGADS